MSKPGLEGVRNGTPEENLERLGWVVSLVGSTGKLGLEPLAVDQIPLGQLELMARGLGLGCNRPNSHLNCCLTRKSKKTLRRRTKKRRRTKGRAGGSAQAVNAALVGAWLLVLRPGGLAPLVVLVWEASRLNRGKPKRERQVRAQDRPTWKGVSLRFLVVSARSSSVIGIGLLDIHPGVWLSCDLCGTGTWTGTGTWRSPCPRMRP